MKIDKINLINYVIKKNSVTKKSVIPMYNQIEKLTNLSAASFGVTFRGKNHTIELDSNTAELERNITNEMRSCGVNTPFISKDNKYTLKGEKAHPNTNPITIKHIRNVLDNILIMDKEGLGHGDLEEGHVFYDKDGDVEFDCFRFSWRFGKNPGRDRDFPNFCYPSNIRDFEGYSLGSYFSKMNPTDEKENPAKNFIKDYLPIASDFHAKRAEYLKQSGKGTDEQIRYEEVLSKVFKNPDNDIIDLFENKVKHQYKRRIAFTEWDEGNGACGHKVDNDRSTRGVKMYFDSIYDGSKYIEKINKLQSTSSGIKLEYLDYEKKDMEHILNNTINDTCGMAMWTMNPDNPNNIFHRNIPKKERDFFELITENFKKIPANSKILGSEAIKLKNNYTKILETHSI